MTSGQAVVLFKDSASRGECLTDGRDSLRILMNILGIGNEYQRTDRNVALEFPSDFAERVPATLRPANLLAIQPDLALISDFDLDSITMVSPTRFAANNAAPTFTVRRAGRTVPTEAKLSRTDCEALNNIYECGLDCNVAAGKTKSS